jgi:hypothetical protein
VVKRESEFGEHVKPGEAIQDTMGKANGGEALEYPWSNNRLRISPTFACPPSSKPVYRFEHRPPWAGCAVVTEREPVAPLARALVRKRESIVVEHEPTA